MNSELEYILQYKHFLILNPPYLNKVMVIRVAKPHHVVVQSCTQSNQCGTKLFWKLYIVAFSILLTSRSLTSRLSDQQRSEKTPVITCGFPYEVSLNKITKKSFEVILTSHMSLLHHHQVWILWSHKRFPGGKKCFVFKSQVKKV